MSIEGKLDFAKYKMELGDCSENIHHMQVCFSLLISFKVPQVLLSLCGFVCKIGSFLLVAQDVDK